MWVEWIDAEHPGLIFSAIFLNKLDCFLGTPVGLVEMWRDVVNILRRFFHAPSSVRILLRDCLLYYQRFRINTLCALPVCVFVSERVRFSVVMAVLEVAVSIIYAVFLRIEGTGEMEFTNQSTVVTILRECVRNEAIFIMFGENRIAVACDTYG